MTPNEIRDIRKSVEALRNNYETQAAALWISAGKDATLGRNSSGLTVKAYTLREVSLDLWQIVLDLKKLEREQ